MTTPRWPEPMPDCKGDIHKHTHCGRCGRCCSQAMQIIDAQRLAIQAHSTALLAITSAGPDAAALASAYLGDVRRAA